MNTLAYVVIACAAFWLALAILAPRVAATLLVAGGLSLLIVAALSRFRKPDDEA